MVSHKLDVLKNATILYLTIDGNVEDYEVRLSGKALVVLQYPSSDVYVRFTKSKDCKGFPLKYIERIEEDFDVLVFTIENYVSETIMLGIEHQKVKIKPKGV